MQGEGGVENLVGVQPPSPLSTRTMKILPVY